MRHFHCLRLFAHKILINYKEERVNLQRRSLGRCHFNEVTEVSTISNGPSREPAAPKHLMGCGETPAKDTTHKPNRGAPSTATAQQSSELSRTHLRTRRRSQTEQQMRSGPDPSALWMPLGRGEEHMAGMVRRDDGREGLSHRDHAQKREVVIGHQVNDSLGNGSGEKRSLCCSCRFCVSFRWFHKKMPCCVTQALAGTPTLLRLTWAGTCLKPGGPGPALRSPRARAWGRQQALCAASPSCPGWPSCSQSARGLYILSRALSGTLRAKD